ncbi:histidine--tRNA ligase: cytoplasmic-like isoform X1 [Dinothrombium tinctorium]|uniref:histidine--tRNA ligase n=1 Tax=Dinothrombium tinctorium TaxID=1965070 RepID=A0A3S3SIU9_9ACAR|nr:histidine--tRNA ligase: cytoplasmic-like isoform X1 [Dinothrombium tinctorium]
MKSVFRLNRTVFSACLKDAFYRRVQSTKQHIEDSSLKCVKHKATLNNEEERRATLRTPSGMRDYGHPQTAVREKVLQLIADCFKRHGAQAIETPVCELKQILTGTYGDDSKQIYDLTDQGEMLSLRYDLTVPFARHLAQYKIGSMKRYQIGKVYRRDNIIMTRGRYREFYQCDFDIAGVCDPLIPDAECLRVIVEILNSLDMKNFEIKVNNRKIIEALFSICEVPNEKFKTICSSIDKLEKLSWEEVKREMCEDKGLNESIADRLGQYVKLNGSLQMVEELLSSDLSKNAKMREGLEEVKLLFNYCRAMGINNVIKFDMSLARGLDYYTGVIFEAILLDEHDVGSVAGGGRYDDLVALLSNNKHIVPCVGVSIGVERIFTLMESKEGAMNFYPAKCFVASMGKGLAEERFKLLTELWDAGIAAEHSLRTHPKPLNQYQYCEEKGIPFLIGIGGDELSKGVVKIRNIKAREEIDVKREFFVDELKKLLTSLTFICSLSTAFKSYNDLVDVQIGSVKRMVKNVADYSAGREKNDLGFLTFNLDADFTNVFDWNTKQLFLYLSAQYKTKNNVNNEVVLWDHIIRRGEESRISFKNRHTKYYFWDDGNGLKGNDNITLTLSMNIIPNAGLLPITTCRTIHTFSFPNEYMSKNA